MAALTTTLYWLTDVSDTFAHSSMNTMTKNGLVRLLKRRHRERRRWVDAKKKGPPTFYIKFSPASIITKSV